MNKITLSFTDKECEEESHTKDRGNQYRALAMCDKGPFPSKCGIAGLELAASQPSFGSSEYSKFTV